MLKFRVEGQKLTWENPDEVVVAGTKKYLECYFEFDGDEWSGFEHIDVFFKNGRDKPVQMLLVGNRIRKEDGLCLAAGDWAVYLRAVVAKKKVDEEGNVVYEEDGVTPVMELERQMTSSSVSVRVLAHGQFENVQNSFESPEIAEQYIEQMFDVGNAMSVFEEWNPEKEYFKHNRVAFEGSSYVLIAESAKGTNPTDTASWLCIAEKGDRGEQGQQGVKGDKGDKGDKGVTGGKIFSYALGYGKNVEVGSYIAGMPPYELINEGIGYGDIIVDTDGGCIFQYVGQLGGDGDDDAVLPAEGLHCIANPNGEKGDKGDKGEQGTQGVQGIKGKDGFLGNEYKGEYPDDVLYGDSDTVTFNSYTKANIGDYMIAEPSVMTQFGNAISLWMCTECEDIYGNGNEYKLTFKRKFSYGNVLPAVGEYTQKRVLVTEDGSQPKWEDFPDSIAVDTILSETSTNPIANFAVNAAVRELSSVQSALSATKADADLSNVTNADFKAKAEEAGVGGDAGLTDEKNFMVFKDVVDALPETANEGEVYALKGPVDINNPKWIQVADAARVGDQFNMTEQGSNIVITNPSETIVDVIKDIVNTYGGVPTLIKVEGLSYTGATDNPYTVGCEAACNIVSTDFSYEDYREYGGPLMVNIPVEMVSFKGNEYGEFFCDGIVNIYTATRSTTSHVRHNGEWIPLVD